MASGYDLQSILGHVALGKVISATKDGIPNPFPPWLFEVKEDSKVIGNSVKFNRIYGERRTARLAQYGASARRRELKQEELVEVSLLHFFEEQPIPPLVMMQLRDYESYDNQKKGMRTVAHNVKTFATLFQNTRIAQVGLALANGTIFFDKDGNVLTSSSGQVETVLEQVPSANQGTITDAAGNGIFGASGTGGAWNVAATDIPLQLRRLQELAAQKHGYVPRIALYGKNIPSYMTQNNYVLDYLARQPALGNEWVKDNTIPNGLFGLTWVPAWTFNFQDQNGAAQSVWPANQITFLPGEEDRDSWWEMFEGSYLVPRTVNIVADAKAAMDNMELVYGSFGYGTLTHNPPSISTYLGDTFLGCIKNGSVVYQADTVS